MLLCFFKFIVAYHSTQLPEQKEGLFPLKRLQNAIFSHNRIGVGGQRKDEKFHLFNSSPQGLTIKYELKNEDKLKNADHLKKENVSMLVLLLLK